jgi:hypothetical protein
MRAQLSVLDAPDVEHPAPGQLDPTGARTRQPPAARDGTQRGSSSRRGVRSDCDRGALHQLRDFLDSEIFAGAVLSHLQVLAFPAIQRFEPWNSEIAIS